MLIDQATYAAYATGWALVRRVPRRTAYASFERLADQLWRRRGSGVQRLEANLARVVGSGASPQELRELSHEGMRSYMRYWCDAFRLPDWSDEELDDFEFLGIEHLRTPIEAGRGAIVVVPHMGNWDHIGAYASRHIAPVATVVERLKPQRLYQEFVDLRTSRGITVYPHDQPRVLDRLREALGQGGLVALISDRDLSARGIDVTFHGETARFPAGAAALAVDTGAPLVPVGMFWTGQRNASRAYPELTPPDEGDRAARIRATVQMIAESFEPMIRDHPADWHMLQPLWLADLDPARLAAQERPPEEPGVPA